MKSIKSFLAAFAVIPLFASCAATSSISSTKPRTITLDDIPVSEEFVGQFDSWKCKDSIYDSETLVEVGILTEHEGIGFVLYDGGDSGDVTNYERKGINHRWDWGNDDRFNFAFVVEADGTGRFYDFSNLKAGESKGANASFKCHRTS
jgi:hypothetical protein